MGGKKGRLLRECATACNMGGSPGGLGQQPTDLVPMQEQISLSTFHFYPFSFSSLCTVCSGESLEIRSPDLANDYAGFPIKS